MSRLKGKLYRVWVSYGHKYNPDGAHEIMREVTASDVVAALTAVAGVDPDIPEVTVTTIEQVADFDRMLYAEEEPDKKAH